jgi:filamentous hemagglutinin family protein
LNPTTFQKNAHARQVRTTISACGLTLFLLSGLTYPVLGNPTGGTVVAGHASIGSAGLTLTINQSSHNAIINWQQFSIANGETTKFLVPNSSSATLNRVTGGNPSAIYGSLQSNGVLYLANPNGVVVGPNGRIDTAGFVASTLDISNEQFLKGGDLNFAGSSNASINNEGTIHASTGDVYLIANQVNNNGTLSAPQGNVGLAAGSEVLFQQSGNQHLFVQATPAGATRANGVTNAGTIRAAAAELKAAGGNAYALAINNSGSIAATGYKKVNGQVYLTSDGGNITNTGRISAHKANGNGGTIVMNGNGPSPSGTVNNSGTLDASATAPGGQGGTIETSGESLQINGTVTAGKGGNWLLDPGDVTIDNGSGTAPDVNVATLQTALNGGTNETVQASGGNTDSGNIDLNAALTWTSSATLQLTATGNINLNQALSGTAGGLILSGGGAIADTADLAVSTFILQNGTWTQNTASLPAFAATHDFELQNSSTFLRVTGGNGTSSPYQITDVYGLQGLASPSKSLLTANAELMNDIDASSTATWRSNEGFSPIGIYDGNSTDANTYSGTFNGQDHTISGLTVNTPGSGYAGLFGDTANAAVLENVNLTGVAVHGGSYSGGLVGVCNGTLTNVSSSGTVTGTSIAGGLLGILFGTLNEASSGGTVSSGGQGDDIGGLVGYFQSGSISNAFSTANVTTGASSNTVGGLIGVNFGTLHNTYSDGTITHGTGSTDVGALVGVNDGTIQNSFWNINTAGVTLGVGSSTSNTTPGLTSATTADLESQSFILAHAPTAPTWNFTSIWTTNGGTTTAEVTGLPVSGSGGSTGGSGGNTGGGSTGGSGGGSNGGSGGSTGGGSSSGSTTGSGTATTAFVPSTDTGGADDSGSNLVPPVLTTQQQAVSANPPVSVTLNTVPPAPPVGYTGNGMSSQVGQQGGGLASASSTGDTVGANDELEVGPDGVNNAANPAAAGTLTLALGPVVYHNLADALKELGDWANVPPGPAGNDAAGGDQETILGVGDVVEMDKTGLKNIPADQAPAPLKNAMRDDVLKGMGR